MIPIERTHEYRGRYHVLGGALSPIDGVEPEDLKIAQLYARIAGAETPVPRGRPRHQPDHHRRGHRPPHRGRPARAGARGRRDPPRLRPAGRRRSRVRRRGHPRPGVRGPASGSRRERRARNAGEQTHAERAWSRPQRCRGARRGATVSAPARRPGPAPGRGGARPPWRACSARASRAGGEREAPVGALGAAQDPHDVPRPGGGGPRGERGRRAAVRPRQASGQAGLAAGGPCGAQAAAQLGATGAEAVEDRHEPAPERERGARHERARAPERRGRELVGAARGAGPRRGRGDADGGDRAGGRRGDRHLGDPPARDGLLPVGPGGQAREGGAGRRRSGERAQRRRHERRIVERGERDHGAGAESGDRVERRRARRRGPGRRPPGRGRAPRRRERTARPAPARPRAAEAWAPRRGRARWRSARSSPRARRSR